VCRSCAWRSDFGAAQPLRVSSTCFGSSQQDGRWRRSEGRKGRPRRGWLKHNSASLQSLGAEHVTAATNRNANSLCAAGFPSTRANLFEKATGTVTLAGMVSRTVAPADAEIGRFEVPVRLRKSCRREPAGLLLIEAIGRIAYLAWSATASSWGGRIPPSWTARTRQFSATKKSTSKSGGSSGELERVVDVAPNAANKSISCGLA
jgi:hypothetical protein